MLVLIRCAKSTITQNFKNRSLSQNRARYVCENLISNQGTRRRLNLKWINTEFIHEQDHGAILSKKRAC